MSNFEDVSGQTFKNLLAIKYLGQKCGNSNYLCKCLLCGKEFEIKLMRLKNQGRCKECSNKARIIDLSGRKYGRLTVLSLSHKINRATYWECQCECGNKITLPRSAFISGNTKSCGCLSSESKSERFFKHGMTLTPEYRAWSAMVARTTNQKVKYSERYIGRGITVCDEWRYSFKNFYKDMGERPSLKHSLDRVDNDGNYEPGNCKWATKEEQSNNTSTNIYITIDGVTKTPRQWSNITGISFGAIHHRLGRGWSPRDAVMEKLRRVRKPML